jgi:DNA repair protein RecN (Recombination protein N)
VLTEIVVRDLGPVRELSLVLQAGLTALTGETGAGKTLLTEAIKLLCGGRGDTTMVRSGAAEAVVEGRFVSADREFVVRRVVPASGRSRSYLDGNLATLGELASVVGGLVDIHGQNGHQSLVRPRAQRDALDEAGHIDTTELREARSELTAIDRQLEELGGDARARGREIDLHRFQLDELDGAEIVDADEDERLQLQERTLADATEHRAAAAASAEALGGEGATDAIALAIARLAPRAPFVDQVARLRSIEADLIDVVHDLGRLAEDLVDDPEALDHVQRRRTRLSELRRKYGSTLAEVLDYRDEARKRLAELESHDARAAQLDAMRSSLADRVADLEASIGAARRTCAPAFASALQQRVRQLALPNAVIEVAVGDIDPGDQVEIRVAMNSGAEPAPLAKVASGGELSRTMLALQLELSSGPPVMVFDEVDAGVGGQAANTVADALAGLGGEHQVLVVTHLAQVAAGADHQIQIRKLDDGTSTDVVATVLDSDARVGEVARMLSGEDSSDSALAHARELLGHTG